MAVKLAKLKKEIQDTFGQELAKVCTNPKSLAQLLVEVEVALKNENTQTKYLAISILNAIIH